MASPSPFSPRRLASTGDDERRKKLQRLLDARTPAAVADSSRESKKRRRHEDKFAASGQSSSSRSRVIPSMPMPGMSMTWAGMTPWHGLPMPMAGMVPLQTMFGAVPGFAQPAAFRRDESESESESSDETATGPAPPTEKPTQPYPPAERCVKPSPALTAPAAAVDVPGLSLPKGGVPAKPTAGGRCRPPTLDSSKMKGQEAAAKALEVSKQIARRSIDFDDGPLLNTLLTKGLDHSPDWAVAFRSYCKKRGVEEYWDRPGDVTSVHWDTNFVATFLEEHVANFLDQSWLKDIVAESKLNAKRILPKKKTTPFITPRAQ